MNPEIQKYIDQEIQKAVAGLNFKVPLHRHTGVDAPKISSNNILTNNDDGFVFLKNTDIVNFFQAQDSGTLYLLEGQTPSTIPLVIGSFSSSDFIVNGTGGTITITGQSGTFIIGETITGGTSGATGIITSAYPNNVRVKTITGTFAVAETITGGTSGATATTSVISLDELQLYFANSPKLATLTLNKSQSKILYTTGVGTNACYLDLTSGTSSTLASDGTNIAESILTAVLQKYTATGNFAIQLPQSSLPTAVEGMIAYDGTNFRGVDSAGTWKTFTLV